MDGGRGAARGGRRVAESAILAVLPVERRAGPSDKPSGDDARRAGRQPWHQTRIGISFLYGSYNGAMVVALTEVVPEAVRTAGFSLAYSLAAAVFGGMTPLVSTRLIDWLGDEAAPGLWMSGGGACGLAATLLVYRGQPWRETGEEARAAARPRSRRGRPDATINPASPRP